jgi:hypothetical protein
MARKFFNSIISTLYTTKMGRHLGVKNPDNRMRWSYEDQFCAAWVAPRVILVLCHWSVVG